MSKIHLRQSRESLIGYALFAGAFILFLINAVFIIQMLIAVYGQKSDVTSNTAIDGTVISDAIERIRQDE